MNILFLDIDGVLNSHPYWISTYERLGRRMTDEEMINPECMCVLRAIVKELDLKIVITSAKFVEDLKNLFKRYDLTILDRIGCYGGARGTYIRKWLSEHDNVNKFVILDDDFFDDYVRTGKIYCQNII